MELVGKKFGKWIVLSYEGKNENRAHLYKVKCECGNESISDKIALTRGKSTQCKSCARKSWRERNTHPVQTHGYSSTKHPHYSTYCIWLGIKQRCLNPKVKNYHIYGGRGIKICHRWKNSFENFLNDMGIKPPGLSIDRINNDGDYCKENCRWATREQQSNNQSYTVFHEFNGEKLSETQWARKLGISRNKLMWWARKCGIKWVIQNIETLKQKYYPFTSSTTELQPQQPSNPNKPPSVIE